MFVLDEADEMLSRGFKDQIYEAFKTMPQEVQVCSHVTYLCSLVTIGGSPLRHHAR